MDLARAILDALSATGSANVLTACAIYIAVPLITHIQIQFLKYDRRERQLRELGRWTLRGIAFVMAASIALFIGWRLGDWPFEVALDHAVNVGVMYPLAMWALMGYIRDRYPDAYRKLNAPRRRTADNGSPIEDDPLSTTWAGKT